MRPANKRVPSGIQSRTARAGSARPPITSRTQSSSQLSRHNATLSPTNSIASEIASRTRSPVAGTKRKERDYELEGTETNIHVVVRCRGRNDREVKENSGVVVSTEGARGKTVDLSMGPNALSNKIYHFDKVFSPAADQLMIYDDVVAPVLDEMISGYNCTIFAYGQTGTGKTYTMSGDMTDTLGLLSDAAGIIPRTLYSLFRKLEVEETESTVKISFIELYNEELRDLLASDEGTKLKLYDADQKKGQTATIVQGMEESHINSAQEGIRLLQEGSHKRQVAATKCNDLSSRSHTIFTMTVYTKRTGDGVEDWVVSGKLNLVDLAGSENIQRSGAENKRAAEAGLINKSLLTLGRVINALVDKAQHIPYRESKLTRLLQDSLGGRTKTYIIATISPAKSNLEETISTLDYAFRAKNIRNKPQINQPISKKTLLREYTAEIQQLKSELIATRQRNGVYLSNDHYEQITVESESRRILSEEQRAKIETMEANLRNKIQDLYSLTNSLAIVKKDSESTRMQLDRTNDVLQQTEMVLADAKQNLFEETILRKAHQATEEQLNQQGQTLLSTLSRTVNDVDGLRAKIRRKSDMQSVNRNNWQASQANVIDVTELVDERINQYHSSQDKLAKDHSARVREILKSGLSSLEDGERTVTTFTKSSAEKYLEATQQSQHARIAMDTVLEEIKDLREDVKTKVGTGLQDLSSAAARISAGVIAELDTFHTELNDSYRSLGKDMKVIFDELHKKIRLQKTEAEELRHQLVLATQAAREANDRLGVKLNESLEKERNHAMLDRQKLLSQITDLVNANGVTQDQRMTAQVQVVREELQLANTSLQSAEVQYQESMDIWLEKEDHLTNYVIQSRDEIKTKLQHDWDTVEGYSTNIKDTTKAIHQETVQVVNSQIEIMATQMQSLDDFVSRAKAQNKEHEETETQLLRTLCKDVEATHGTVLQNIKTSKRSLDNIQAEADAHSTSTTELVSEFVGSVHQPLIELQASINSTSLTEYEVTGSTPQKTNYVYPQVLAKTASHAKVLGKDTTTQAEDPLILPIADLLDATTPSSPGKGNVYTDAQAPGVDSITAPHLSRQTTSDSLREIPVNIISTVSERECKTEDLSKSLIGLNTTSLMGPPLLKRNLSNETRTGNGRSGKPNGIEKSATNSRHHQAEGRENSHVLNGPPIRLTASVGSGGSGHGHTTSGAGPRRLRSSARHE